MCPGLSIEITRGISRGIPANPWLGIAYGLSITFIGVGSFIHNACGSCGLGIELLLISAYNLLCIIFCLVLYEIVSIIQGDVSTLGPQGRHGVC